MSGARSKLRSKRRARGSTSDTAAGVVVPLHRRSRDCDGAPDAERATAAVYPLGARIGLSSHGLGRIDDEADPAREPARARPDER